MPKKDIDYSNTIIYKIACKTTSCRELYVGHTTNFVQKKYNHKQCCTNEESKKYNCHLYKVIRENGGWENWLMEIIICVNCKDKYDATQKENEYCLLLNDTLNNIEKRDFYEKEEKNVNKSVNNVNKSVNYKIIPKKNYECEKCNKKYDSRVGLWKHNKQCNGNDLLENEETENDNMSLAQMFMEIMKQNKELQNQLFELAKEKSSITNNNNSINNTMNNNKFNLTLFLNETCKDAMNIQEFIDYVTVQHSDFENFGKMGYVEALTRIFLRNLMELEVHRRPIHCSDSKREVLYVKDNNVWTSDVTREKLIRTIKYIANKNVKQIPGWMDKNPDSKNTQTKLHDKYMRMLCFSMGAKTEEEDQEYYKKIIRNVAKEVCIDKSQ